MTNFSRAVDVVLEREGVFSNAPTDPGGETWFGISRKYHPNAPWPPSKDQAIAIYFNDYWSRAGCDTLSYPLALAVFDCAVNQGVGTAIQLLHNATLAAKLDLAKSDPEVLASFLALRTQRYVSIRDTNAAEYAENNRGWFRRLFLISIAGAQPQ